MRFAQWSLNALAVLAALLPTADADPGHGNREVSDNDRGHSLQLDSRSLSITEAAAEERLCNIPIMTPEVWMEKKDDIDAWMRGIMQRYRENPGNSPSFFSFVLETNFPSLVPGQTACDIINECSPVSCNHFRAILEGESQEKFEHERTMAIYASNALTNFHNFYRHVLTAFTAAAVSVDQMHDSLWRDFSWLDNQAAHERVHEQKKKQTQQIMSTGLSLVLIVTGIFGPIVGNLMPLGDIAKTVIQGINSGIVSGVYAGASSIYGSMPVHKAPITRDFLELQGRLFDRLWRDATKDAKKLLQATTMALMEGKEDGPNGKNVIDTLKEGGFYFPFDRDIVLRLQDHLEKELSATSISLMWNGQDTTNAWIVRSDAPEGMTCEEDDRINILAKVCLPDEPQSTYFVAGTDSFNDQYLSEIHLLPGWKTMIDDPGKYFNLTNKDVVASSVRWWRETHNRGILGKPGNGFDLTKFLGRIDRIGVSSVHLPVCNSPRGEALSSLNRKPRLTYPCVCSKMDGSPDVHSRKSETYRVLKTSGLIARDKVWTHCKEQMLCSGVGGNPWKVNHLRTIKGKHIHKGWEEEVFTAWGAGALGERDRSTWGTDKAWTDEESNGGGGP